MKKFKKILTATTASLLCLSSLTALSSNAVYTFGYPNDKELLEKMLVDGVSLFQAEDITFDAENLITYAYWIDNDGVPHHENSYSYFSDNSCICTVESHPQQMVFTMQHPTAYVTDEGEQMILDFLNEMYPDVHFEIKSTGPAEFSIYDYDALPFDNRLDTVEDAEKVYNFIAENFPIKSCEFYGNCLSPMFGYIGAYSYIYSYKGDTSYAENTAAILQSYIDEKGYDVELEENVNCMHGVDYNYSRCYLKPTRKMSSQEMAKLYTDIYHDLDLKPGYSYMELAYYTQPLNLCKIDGDANADNVLGMADATLILQSLTNKDEYGLTEQGMYNADFDKDGITASDALTIQKILAESGEY